MMAGFPRLDRWLSLSPAMQWATTHAKPGFSIPILMYHSIAEDVDDAVHPYFRTVTTTARFAAHIDLLLEHRYKAVTLSEATRLLTSAMSSDVDVGKVVVLTFDDGFRDFLTEAFPVLDRAGYRATVFLPTDFIGRPFLNGRPCLRADEIRELSCCGTEFGSHSASHSRLDAISRGRLVDEITRSKRVVQDITGKETLLFSYPFRFPRHDARFIASLADLLEENGFRSGVTTTIGRANARDDLLFLPRLPMNDCDDSRLLLAKLQGHYDWLRAAQSLRKRIRAVLQFRAPE